MTWGQSQEVISGMRLQNERKVQFLMKKKPTYDIINQLLGGNVMIVLLDSLGNTAPLFEGWEETIIWSCLEKTMGHVYGDARENRDPRLQCWEISAAFGKVKATENPQQMPDLL